MHPHLEITDTAIPAFITKLWHMVSDSSTDDLISWGQEDTSFVIKNEQRFCSELLPRYYKHNNMSSFIRQLNKYDFHKVISAESLSLRSAIDKQELEFVHPYFIRNHPALLSQIKRKLSNSKEISEFKGDHNILTKLVKEVQQLQTKQELVESKLIAMKNENDALWREHAIMKQKHQNQQKIVNKLVQFLVSLVRGINIRGGIPLMVKDSIIQPVDGLKAIKARGFGDNSNSSICEVDHLGKPVKCTTSNGNIAELLTFQNIHTAQNDELQQSLYSRLESPKDSTQVKVGTKRKLTKANIPKEVRVSKLPKPDESIVEEPSRLDLDDLTAGFEMNSPHNFPIVTSPSGVVINSPSNSDFLIDDNSKPVEVVDSPSNDVESSSVPVDLQYEPQVSLKDDQSNSNDMEVHLEGIQSDLDALKDILKSENLSFDASTIMSVSKIHDSRTVIKHILNICKHVIKLFNTEGGFSLNNVPDDVWSEVKLPLGSDDSGNELVPYSTPNLFDMVNALTPVNADVPQSSVVPDLDTSLPDLDNPLTAELNTPLPITEHLLGLNESEDL